MHIFFQHFSLKKNNNELEATEKKLRNIFTMLKEKNNFRYLIKNYTLFML